MNISHVCIGLSISHFKTREGQYVHKETHHRDTQLLRS
jgi:hypothetical protein